MMMLSTLLLMVIFSLFTIAVTIQDTKTNTAL